MLYYIFSRKSKIAACTLVSVGGYCPDSCTKKASNNSEVMVADPTYTVFVVIPQLRREASHVSLQSRQLRAADFHNEDAYKGLYLYRSCDENIITVACLDACLVACRQACMLACDAFVKRPLIDGPLVQEHIRLQPLAAISMKLSTAPVLASLCFLLHLSPRQASQK